MRKTKYYLLFYVLFSSSLFAQKDKKFDVVIYGGTSAGVIAAYTAKKAGKSVLLIEPGRHLGGMSSGGLGYTDIGNKYVVTGLARDFYRRLGRHYEKLEQWIFEPRVAEAVFNQYVKEAGIKVWYGKRLSGVKKKKSVIDEIILEDTYAPQNTLVKKVKAKVYLDCSYEGDLMAKSGASYTVGREDNSIYNETFNGVQVMKGHQFWDDIDPYRVKGDSKSGLLWGVSSNERMPDGTGDKKVQAYNFRITLTDEPANMIPITEPDNYDPKKYELLIRLHETTPRKSLHDIFIWSLMPNRKTDINNKGPFSTDMIGMNWEYPEADYKERTKIWQDHMDYTKGLLYFVGNDPRMPENIRNEMKKWGYPKDEYTDNNHWSHQLYIRESRRLKGQLIMTQHHCLGREICSDTIGWAAYTMDSHNCDRIIINSFVRNEGNVEEGGFPPYPISYRAIVPQKEDVTNLIVPVCLSASHIAYGSIRMEPIFMVLAQSAAVAASMSIDNRQAVQDIDLVILQKRIKNDPLGDGSIPEILIDNDDTSAVSIDGEWYVQKDTHRSYGAAASFLVGNNSGGRKSVKYTPDIKIKGKYDIYLYFPITDYGSKLTTVNISDGKKIIEKVIDKSRIIVEGQTAGEWIHLGEYDLPEGSDAYVEITNKNAKGMVVADAVLFLPHR